MEDFSSQMVNLGGGNQAVVEGLPFKGHMTELQLEGAFCRNPTLFGEDLLVIGRQLADFAEDNRRLDVLAVDRMGEKVLVEFKVDPEYPFTELQAMAYAGAYANVKNEFFPKALHRAVTSSTDDAVRGATGLGAEVSIEEVTKTFLDFLDLTDIDEWNPSKQVRIKIIAPDFPPRVLHNIKWLSEVYEMPIEAVQVELFAIGGDLHLRSDRIYPLPGVDRFELSLREQEASKRKKNTSPAKSVLPLLVKAERLNPGDPISMKMSGLPKKIRDQVAGDMDDSDPRLTVYLDPSDPAKVIWRADEDAEPISISPSRLPAYIAHAILGIDLGDVLGVAVGDNYFTKDGVRLSELAIAEGLWPSA